MPRRSTRGHRLGFKAPGVSRREPTSTSAPAGRSQLVVTRFVPCEPESSQPGRAVRSRRREHGRPHGVQEPLRGEAEPHARFCACLTTPPPLRWRGGWLWWWIVGGLRLRCRAPRDPGASGPPGGSSCTTGAAQPQNESWNSLSSPRIDVHRNLRTIEAGARETPQRPAIGSSSRIRRRLRIAPTTCPLSSVIAIRPRGRSPCSYANWMGLWVGEAA
jgi:hypothetical protein